MQQDTTVVFVNQYVLDLFDCVREDVIGSTIKDLAGMMKNRVDYETIEKRIAEGTLTDYEVQLSVDGVPDMTCRLSAFSVMEVDPYPECLTLVIRDVSEERATAELIKAKSIEMAKINTELARSNTELKKVSELKSNFLSIASHELNTPLTSIKGYSDIIIDNMKDKVEPNIYRMIESISRAADRLHKVVNNILDVTKIEQGRLRLRPEQIDLGAILRDCVEESSQMAEKRGIVFRVNVEEGLPQWKGDKMRMQQMFANLFNNAVKYSPDGASIKVGIALEQGTRFHITVRDHGIGIDKSEHKNIFDSFYEVGNANRHTSDTSKFMGGGSGLGLSIVKGIVERHGGKVWVESEGVREGAFPGSEFHVILPLRSAISWDDDESHVESSENRFQAADAIDFDSVDDEDLAKPVILFIDPDKESMEIASTAIENVFDILVAESGEQGLIIAFNQKPSLILMDSDLPGLDGYRICRILRSQEETKSIPVAFISAGAGDAEIQKCFASGADDFIVKPFSGRELVDKACRLLMRKKDEEMLQ
jgi:signal transduction histidine kinase